MKTRSLVKTTSSFPSDVSVVKGKIYSQGGFLLLKVDKDDDSKEEEISFQITLIEIVNNVYRTITTPSMIKRMYSPVKLLRMD